MRKKPRKTVVGILRDYEAVPITDPAEQAALDRRCREAEKMLASQRRNGGSAKSNKKKAGN